MKNWSSVALTTLILCSLGATAGAQAGDMLGLYVGASFGQAHIRAEQGDIVPQAGGTLDMTHSAFKGMLGIRVLSFLGAEVAYMDFGKVSSMPGSQTSTPLPAAITAEQVSQKGEAAFALLYLPVPIVDVYVKAGLSRITTDSSATVTPLGVATCAIDRPNCGAPYFVSHDFTDTGFAYGAGLQWKLGDWAVRGEYERFDGAGENPSLLSIGMTYWIQ